MIDQLKKKIRKEIKEIKLRYSFEQKNELSIGIFNRLEQEPAFIKAKTIMLYWSMKDEVHTHDFVYKWANKKQIILPSVAGDNLILKEYKGLDQMSPGEGYGILEPEGPEFCNPKNIDLIIVPGIAFDKHNNRMGRGKAYYDKLLTSLNATKIGICFDFQLLETVPTDEHDIKMDLVITN